MNKVRHLCLAIIAASALPACSNHIKSDATDEVPTQAAKKAPVYPAALPIKTAQQPHKPAYQQSAPAVPHINEAPILVSENTQPQRRQQPQVQRFTQQQHRPVQQARGQYQKASYFPTHYPTEFDPTDISDQELLAFAQQFTRPVNKPQNNFAHQAPAQSRNELLAIGNKIFQNECGGQKSKLVHWNVGENFASMGIGHFLWHPSGPRRHKFGNTFPGLLDFMKTKGVQLPQWLEVAKNQGAPWRSRTHLASSRHSRQVKDLENLLYNTRDIQAEYIVQRAKRAMPKIAQKSPAHLRPIVAQNLNAVGNTPGGWYALVDYVNFKGEGLNRHGGYKRQNWGLLQVLETMRASEPGQQALNNFSVAALNILKRRIRNSPPARNEARWLAGWSNRVNTYRNPLL